MTLTVELSPDEERRLRAAGIDLTALVRGIASSLPNAVDTSGAPAPDTKNAAAIVLLQELNRQGAITNPAAMRQAEAELDELLQNLNENRLAAGERPLFPDAANAGSVV